MQRFRGSKKFKYITVGVISGGWSDPLSYNTGSDRDCELIDVFQLLNISTPTSDWALVGGSKNLI